MKARPIAISDSPFWCLVRHFVKRMFAGEEAAGNGMGLGIGAVLALLASPGALACFLLLEKYASPLLLLHGHRFDAYKLSLPDEYFFVVLSMTIMGLVMVLRWNRLFPDRQDFANLAALPVSARDVFLANFTALFGLALLFAAVVNGVSAFLFPAVVTFADGRFSAFLRVAASHSAAVFCASLFSFFTVFALVGVLMLTVPKRMFRSISVGVRVLLVVALLTEFFSNLFVQLLAGSLAVRPDAYMRLLPSFWFLGLYERVAGFATPAMNELSMRALLALLSAIAVSLAAYSLCYGNHYLRLAESIDIIGSPQHRMRLPLPPRLERALFRSRLERACFAFTWRTLLRSERHVMFFGAYFGMGLVLVGESLTENLTQRAPSVPGASLLAAPILIAFVLLTGLRFAFDIPAILPANWLFRSAVEKPSPPLRIVARKLALTLTLPWQLLLLAPLMAHRFGWRIALEHTGAVMALTVFGASLLFARFRSIPFTCSVQPDVQRFLTRILGALFALAVAVPLLTALERWMLFHPVRFIPAGLLLLTFWLAFRAGTHDAFGSAEDVIFEERSPSAFELLKLA